MYENKFYTLEFKDGCLLYGIKNGRAFKIGMPVFELDGKTVPMAFDMTETGCRVLRGGSQEIVFSGGGKSLRLQAVVRVSPDSPVVRFRYSLSRDEGRAVMTKRSGCDNLMFLSYKPWRGAQLTEVRFSDLDCASHSFALSEVPAFEHSNRIMGPMITEEGREYSALLAYEHGSQYPDRFIAFCKEDGKIALRAERGSYYDGRPLSVDEHYQTIWLQFCAVEGGVGELSARYRDFVLRHFSENTESRKPYIYYNTWNFQERNKFRNGKTYSESMNCDRIVREIDAAHAMGVEVFVLDTGWYNMTGDWEVHPKRFPDGLNDIRDRLERYDMKLGLWFDPRVAQEESLTFARYKRYISTYDAEESIHKPFPIWEYERNYILCLYSDYWKVFADRLIALYKEYGVRYFKWDAVWQYDCSNSGHGHGTRRNSLTERRECYAYNINERLTQISERVSAECPGAIFDLDVTEGCRSMGLGFLAVGKYFMINNGPYYRDFGIPIPENADQNVFTYPGPARAAVCRSPLAYDKWIPSVLMLTHYLPDDPVESQLVNLASLILGQNGIWGDLLSVSESGKALIGEVLSEYKKVRNDITAARLKRYGMGNSAFEVYEKINPENGRGAVSIFCRVPGVYRYTLSAPGADSFYARGPATVTRDGGGAFSIECNFTVPSATVLFFH